MAELSEEVSNAWDDRNGPVILTTVGAGAVPNAIYVTCVSRYAKDTLVVADNYFEKTRRNIMDGSKGSILFITKNDKAYQVKGRLEYHSAGPVYEDMKKWNPTKHPGHAALALKVEEVYQGSKKLL